MALSVLFIGLSANAQQSFSTVGADVVGVGGSSCFTVGQALYTCDLGEGSTTYGVQQSYRRCIGDYSGDGVVNVVDLLQLLILFQCEGPCPGDLTGDGVINTGDLLYFLTLFGSVCSP